MRAKYLCSLFLVVGLFCPASLIAEQSSLDQAWDDATLLLIRESYGAFSKALDEKTGDPREAQYGMAVTLLNRQPKTSGNIDRAAELFTQIHSANPDDEPGISSLYFLARIQQFHIHQPDTSKALELYQQLVREHPDHFLAQLAITKIAVIKLYLDANVAGKKRDLAELENFLPLLKDPSLRCNFDYIVGTACIQYRLGDEKAMRYLIEADSLGIPIHKDAANALVRIGNLALRLDRKNIATQYFSRFVSEFPQDQRTYTIREMLAQLPPTKTEAAK